jgi:hypothetical protein
MLFVSRSVISLLSLIMQMSWSYYACVLVLSVHIRTTTFNLGVGSNVYLIGFLSVCPSVGREAVGGEDDPNQCA